MRYNRFVTDFFGIVSKKTGFGAQKSGEGWAREMTCKNCGAKVAANVAFCGKCGAPVTPERPSREEIRARVQGGGRQSAPVRGGAPAARAAGPISLDKSKLFVLIAAILGLLQIVYLFVKSIFISISYGEMTASEGASIYTVLKEGEAGFLGVLLLLFCLALVASIAVPVLLRRQPRPLATIVVAGLTLLLYLICVLVIKKFFDTYNLGVTPHLGLFGWLFILNCLAIAALVFLAGRGEPAPAPARAAAPRQPAARRTAPMPAPRPAAGRKAPMRTGVNGPSRPGAPGRNVTPPDAETIAALRRMAQMHQQGLVSDEEFARIKAECVARGWIRE